MSGNTKVETITKADGTKLEFTRSNPLAGPPIIGRPASFTVNVGKRPQPGTKAWEDNEAEFSHRFVSN